MSDFERSWNKFNKAWNELISIISKELGIYKLLNILEKILNKGEKTNESKQ